MFPWEIWSGEKSFFSYDVVVEWLRASRPDSHWLVLLTAEVLGSILAQPRGALYCVSLSGGVLTLTVTGWCSVPHS